MPWGVPNNFASHPTKTTGKQCKMTIFGFLAPKTISNLKIEPFAFEYSNVSSQNCSKQCLGALQTTLPLIYPYKMTIFPCVWALLARKNVLDRVTLCSYGLTMHFWTCTSPKPSGQVFPCFLALFSASTAI